MFVQLHLPTPSFFFFCSVMVSLFTQEIQFVNIFCSLVTHTSHWVRLTLMPCDWLYPKSHISHKSLHPVCAEKVCVCIFEKDYLSYRAAFAPPQAVDRFGRGDGDNRRGAGHAVASRGHYDRAEGTALGRAHWRALVCGWGWDRRGLATDGGTCWEKR